MFLKEIICTIVTLVNVLILPYFGILISLINRNDSFDGDWFIETILVMLIFFTGSSEQVKNIKVPQS